MRASTAILALAGTALATPHWTQPESKEVRDVHVVYETVVHTVYSTEGQQQAKPTKVFTSVYQAPVVTTTVVYEENAAVPTSAEEVVYETYSENVVYETYSVAPVYKTSEAPVPTSTAAATSAAATSAAATSAAATSAAPAPSATASGYQGIVDTWRAKMGLKALANDAKLESNAMNTVVSSNGEMVHKLNPGTYGQVLAPGNEDDFEHVFVGGWLCEIPTLPGLDGVCSTQSEGWTYDSQTGHAEILTSDEYSKIGCALYAGIWCCDLA